MTYYYLLRQNIPIITFFMFNYLEQERFPEIPSKYLTASFTIGYLILTITTRYIGPIHWGITQLIGFLILSRSYNVYYAANLSLSAVISMAWLYELPWFHPQVMFISNRSYMLHIGLVCTLITLWLLRRIEFRPSTRTMTTLAFFVLWEAVMMVILVNHWNPIMKQAGWPTIEYYVRVGGAVTLLSIFHEMHTIKRDETP